LLLWAIGLASLSGCKVVPVTKWNGLEGQNRNLSELNRAQEAEIANLRAHSRSLEDRVIRSEKQVAVLEERAGLDRRRLDEYQQEREGLYEQVRGMTDRSRLPPESSAQNSSESTSNTYGRGVKR
jgi:hypothetical protein